MITIAIDGPCGAGKSTVAKTLSKKLNISYFNTGDIYRACAYYLINKGVEDPTNTEAINNTIGDANIIVEFVNGVQRTILDGVDVTDELHTTKMNNYTMQSGNNLAVREKIVEIQRSTAKKQSVVMEGRDIGAVILPDANYKFFVTASVATRANRILKDLIKKGCVDWGFLNKYAGIERPYLYANVIKNAKRYDKPKELRDFRRPCPYTDGSYCLEHKCEYYDDYSGNCFYRVGTPPQSWCYVEEIK